MLVSGRGEGFKDLGLTWRCAIVITVKDDEILLFSDRGWGLIVSSDLTEKLPETAGGSELCGLLPFHLRTHFCSTCPHKEGSLKAKAATQAWHWPLCSGWAPCSGFKHLTSGSLTSGTQGPTV